MAYFKINNTDYSAYINTLNVSKTPNYVAQKNAAGDTIVDYINTKHTLTVGFIPMNSEDMAELLTALEAFNVSISFLDPQTNELKNIDCIVPSTGVDYYTIQVNKVLYKTFTITFTEL